MGSHRITEVCSGYTAPGCKCSMHNGPLCWRVVPAVLTQGVWSRCSSMRGRFNEHRGVAFRRMLACLFDWVCPTDSDMWCQYDFPLSIIPSLTCKLLLNISVHTSTHDCSVIRVTTVLGNVLLTTSCNCFMHPGAINSQGHCKPERQHPCLSLAPCGKL